MKNLKEIINKMPEATELKRLLQEYPVNLRVSAKSNKNFYNIQISSIDKLRWQELQTLVKKGCNRLEKQWLLFLYFQQVVTSEDIEFRGNIVGATYDNLTENEKEEIDLYISLFRENNFNFHHQVNDYITKNNLWESFKEIRTLNQHTNLSQVKGIAPKYFAIVCSLLELSNFSGSKLESYLPW